jgi:vacuolar-type H+-ATPase subunit H
MRDVIEKIIVTESEAKQTVEEAKAEANRIMADARKKGRDMIERARQEAITEAGGIVEEAVAAAEREKQERLTRAAADIESEIQLVPAAKKWAVEGVVRCVCKEP